MPFWKFPSPAIQEGSEGQADQRSRHAWSSFQTFCAGSVGRTQGSSVARLWSGQDDSLVWLEEPRPQQRFNGEKWSPSPSFMSALYVCSYLRAVIWICVYISQAEGYWIRFKEFLISISVPRMDTEFQYSNMSPHLWQADRKTWNSCYSAWFVYIRSSVTWI